MEEKKVSKDKKNEIKEYKIEDTIILGIDHGYGNIKTARKIFPTSVTTCDKEPAFAKDCIAYNGKYYIIGEGHKSFVSEKQMDEDNYILTLVAIAKELYARGLSKAKIHLAVGLPLKWVQSQREEFKKYLLRESHISYMYMGTNYEVEIAGCTVMPQCYAAVAKNLKDYKGMNMLADIGNGTINIMMLNNGLAMESKAWTEKLGAFQCFMSVKAEVSDNTGMSLPDEVIENFLRTGNPGVSDKYAGHMINGAKKYIDSVYKCLNDHGYDPDIMKLTFMGGGAKVIEKLNSVDSERVSFITDIRATARGYEYFCYMKLKKTADSTKRANKGN